METQPKTMALEFKREPRVLPILLLAAVLGLGACTGTGTGTTNIITDMSIGGRSSRPSACYSAGDGRPPVKNCTEAEKEALRFAEVGKVITVYPEGQGRCAQATVDFGDGSAMTFSNVAPQSGTSLHTWAATHTYAGWPGKKLMRVKGDSGCLGNVTKDVTVGIGPDGREDFRLGFCAGGPGCSTPPTTVCSAVPMPPIRKGTGVRVEADGSMINYGGNQAFSAGGDRTAPVPAGYLFPHRKKFSLVYRIGTQDVQGEVGPVTFVAGQTGPLEICTNDNPSLLSDNVGGVLLTITVNERSAL